jgi:hypothetical protein
VVATQENERARRGADGQPVCTLQSCPTFDVKKYLHQLQQALPCVPAIPDDALKFLHAAQDYKGIVTFIKKTMKIECHLTAAGMREGCRSDRYAARVSSLVCKRQLYRGTVTK